jgi:hypothetical protein
MINFRIVVVTIFIMLGLILLGFFVYWVQGDNINTGGLNLFQKIVSRKLPLAKSIQKSNLISTPSDFVTLWYTDFDGKRVVGIDRVGNQVWLQRMDASPLPPSGHATHTEYVTVAPNGNLIVSDGEAMFVQEIDRKTHALVWQYGKKDIQSAEDGYLHQPDKSYKLNDNEVLINDGNNRRVIIIDQRINKIVWQYGETLRMGTKPGMLMANTNTVPLNGGSQILITDTLAKKVLIVDRATKKIIWEWMKPDAGWIQHVWPTDTDTFVMEDRNKNEIFEVDKQGKILWTLSTLENGRKISHPTDVIKLGNGNVLIAISGGVLEVTPLTGKIVNEYKKLGYVTTIAIDQNVP